MTSAHAFISYSRKDTAFVEQVEAALNARGILTWRDATSIPGGSRWFRRIKQGLESSYAMIYVDTSGAEESDWAEKEFMYAHWLGLPIFPVKLDKNFMSMQTINLNPILCDAPNFSGGILKLDALLRELTPTPIRAGTIAPPVVGEVEDVTTAEPPEVTAKDIADYLEWVIAEVEWQQLNDVAYVDLSAVAERQPVRRKFVDDDFDFSGIGIERLLHDDFEKPGEPVEDVQGALRKARRAVLLGEPGAGKTTTLRKIVVDLARAAQTDSAAKLPVYVPLREFDGETPFAAFIRAKTHNLQAAFDRLRPRFVLLCDALNEMPRTAKSDGRDLTAEVRATLSGETDWVVSCRVRDYTDDLSAISGIGKIRLKPLDPPRIQQFITRKYAGWNDAARGAALWRDLRGSDLLLSFWQKVSGEGERFWNKQAGVPGHTSGDEDAAWRALHADHRRLLALCRSPFMANMICTLYRLADKLPDNRAGLYATFIANLLGAEAKRRNEVGLAWIGAEPIRAGLGQVAWAMGAQTEMERTAAETILRQHIPAHDPAVVLSAAASAGLIDYGADVRFTHQLLQQYFAAAVLGALMDEDARAPRPAGEAALTPRPPLPQGEGEKDSLLPEGEGLGMRAFAIWQPGGWWRSTGREETAILLAGDRNDGRGWPAGWRQPNRCWPWNCCNSPISASTSTRWTPPPAPR